MQVALITPTPMLHEFATRSSYHLVLADKILSDKKYAQYYSWRVAQGDYVILDNCAYELGEALPNSQLLQCIYGIQPTAMFLPDVRFDSKKTLERIHESLKYFKHHNVKLFAVPQGKDYDDVMECYRQILEIPEITGVGIYEEIGEVTHLGRRSDFLQRLQDLNLVSPDHTYHCLGMEEDIEQIKKIAQFPWISGIDSAKPIVYGIHGIALSSTGARVPYPHRPKNYFDHSDCEFREIVHNNISLVQSWATTR